MSFTNCISYLFQASYTSFQQCLLSSNFLFLHHNTSFFFLIFCFSFPCLYFCLFGSNKCPLFFFFFLCKDTRLFWEENSLIKYSYWFNLMWSTFGKPLFYLISFFSFFDILDYSFYQSVLNIWRLQRTDKWVYIIILHLKKYLLFILLRSYTTTS